MPQENIILAKSVSKQADSNSNTYSRLNRHQAQWNIQYLHIKQRNQIIWKLIFSHIIASCSSFRKDQKSEAFYG